MDGRLTIDFSDQYRQKFSFDWSQRSLYLGQVSGDCVAVLLQSQCGNQELFMKNLVFLRTVTDLTPIIVVLEPPSQRLRQRQLPETPPELPLGPNQHFLLLAEGMIARGSLGRTSY